MSDLEAETIRLQVAAALKKDSSMIGINEAWQVLKDWMTREARACIDWQKISEVVQKPTETVDEYYKRWAEVFVLHSGMVEDSMKLYESTVAVVKSAFLSGLLPEVKKGTKIAKQDWEANSVEVKHLVQIASNIARDVEAQIRMMTVDRQLGKVQHDRKEGKIPSCSNCNKRGHKTNACRLPKRKVDFQKSGNNFKRKRDDRKTHSDGEEGDQTDRTREEVMRRLNGLDQGKLNDLLSAVSGNQ